MNVRVRQSGFSLPEVLMVAAVLGLLAALVLGLGRRLYRQSQERLTGGAIEILVAAMEQYHEAYDAFPFMTHPLTPTDTTTGFTEADLRAVLRGGTAVAGDTVTGTSERYEPRTGTYYYQYESSEALYYFLSREPNSRRLVDTISPSLMTSRDKSGVNREFTFSGQGQPIRLMRFVDAWDRALQYALTPTMSFPVITSAGVDGKFGTSDDLTSR